MHRVENLAAIYQVSAKQHIVSDVVQQMADHRQRYNLFAELPHDLNDA